MTIRQFVSTSLLGVSIVFEILFKSCKFTTKY